MNTADSIFSDSWHRVARLRVQLRPSAQVRRQWFRGERWYVLEDAFNNQFYRFREPVYRLLARLDANRTVEEIWQECLRENPNEAPGQPEVIQLLAQLHQANLLQSELPPDTARLLERRQKRIAKEWQGRLASLFFLKFPVWDPDRWLNRVRPLFAPLFSRWGALAWIVLVISGLKVAVDRWDDLWEQTQGAFSPENLPLLYVAFFLTKGLHEFGHAFMCKKFGGEVHKVGVMLMFFSPVPYVDATSSWRFRERSKRVLVASAGMIVELAVAAVAAFVWANSGPGATHALAYNVMFLASVSTVLVNSNPFLRFDGYFIASDLLDSPNLQQRAWQQLRGAFERIFCGVTNATGPAKNPREAAGLIVFQLASAAYRFALYGGLLLMIADRFFGLGLVLATIFLILFFAVPVVRFFKYLASSPVFAARRGRAWAATGGLAGALAAFLAWCPFPSDFRAPAVLESTQHAEVIAGASGTVEEVVVKSGQVLAAGQPIARLRSPELELELAKAKAEREAAIAVEEKAMQQAAAILPSGRRREAAEAHVKYVEAQREALIVRAPVAGIWVMPHEHETPGAFVARGAKLGEMVEPSAFRFTATVSQHEAARLFTNEIRSASMRLFGQAGKEVPIGGVKIIPADQNKLPAASLGWAAGGEMQIDHRDPSGRKVTEPFFQVQGNVGGKSGALLLHGRAGNVRFVLPPEPLARQWWRRVRQLLQQRYRL
jgi:putative peptide zinc metalloprotease protein